MAQTVFSPALCAALPVRCWPRCPGLLRLSGTCVCVCVWGGGEVFKWGVDRARGYTMGELKGHAGVFVYMAVQLKVAVTEGHLQRRTRPSIAP